MSVDTLKKLGMLEYNNIFHARDMIKGRVEILKTFTSQVEASADMQKEQDIEKQNELKAVQAFVTQKGIKTQSTASGVLVEVQNPGDPQQKADSGKQVKIMYKGTFTDGKMFDTNMDPKGPNSQPMNVLIGGSGQGSVIKGLDEGLRMFGKGGKGRIFIPAMLAYGQNGNPPVIPAYSNIVFDVEILDVVAPAPAPAQPGMQQPPAPKK